MGDIAAQLMSDHKHAPGLPEIVDEARDTPGWVPALGIGLFALILITIAIQLAGAGDNAGATAKPAAAEVVVAE